MNKCKEGIFQYVFSNVLLKREMRREVEREVEREKERDELVSRMREQGLAFIGGGVLQSRNENVHFGVPQS
jgi:hypothetical protein